MRTRITLKYIFWRYQNKWRFVELVPPASTMLCQSLKLKSLSNRPSLEEYGCCNKAYNSIQSHLPASPCQISQSLRTPSSSESARPSPARRGYSKNMMMEENSAWRGMNELSWWAENKKKVLKFDIYNWLIEEARLVCERVFKRPSTSVPFFSAVRKPLAHQSSSVREQTAELLAIYY